MLESGHSAQYGVRSLFRTMAEPPFESTFHKLGSCSIQTAIKSVFLIQALQLEPCISNYQVLKAGLVD